MVTTLRYLVGLAATAGMASAIIGAETAATDASCEAEKGRETPARGEKPNTEEAYHVEADVTEGYYTAGEQVLHGVGNVVIVHGDTTITCDEVYSYESQNLATLLGNVRVRNALQKYTLTSGYAEYHRAEKLSVATKKPRLVLERDRPITITSHIMRMWTEKNYGEAAGNVKIVSDDIEGYGQKLKHFGQENRLELSGKPVIRQGDSRLAGDLITLYLEEEKLRRFRAEGSARLLYFSRPREEEEEGAGEGEGAVVEESEIPGEGENVSPEKSGGEETAVPEEVEPAEEIEPDVAGAEMEATGEEAAGETKEMAEETPTGRVEAAGDKMEGYFGEGALEQVDIVGEATGHYWPFDELGRETGEQIDAAGDMIRIIIEKGAVRKIIIDGNAEGVFRPAKAEGRSGVTRTSGDRISVFVSDREIRRIAVFGHARGSYFTEETPAAEKREVTGG